MIRRFLFPTLLSESRKDANAFSNRIGCSSGRFATLVILLFLQALLAHAQFDTAEVLGTIKDPSGGSISGATVVLTNPAKGTTVSR